MSVGRTVWLSLAFALAPTALLASSDIDTARTAGLLGHWAVDCAGPVSGSNPNLYFTALDDGTIQYRLVVATDGPPIVPSTLSEVTDLGGGLLHSKYVRNSDGNVTLVTNKFSDGRMWSLNAESPDGDVHIKDGAFTSSGSPVPHFEKCGGE